MKSIWNLKKKNRQPLPQVPQHFNTSVWSNLGTFQTSQHLSLGVPFVHCFQWVVELVPCFPKDPVRHKGSQQESSCLKIRPLQCPIFSKIGEKNKHTQLMRRFLFWGVSHPIFFVGSHFFGAVHAPLELCISWIAHPMWSFEARNLILQKHSCFQYFPPSLASIIPLDHQLLHFYVATNHVAQGLCSSSHQVSKQSQHLWLPAKWPQKNAQPGNRYHENNIRFLKKFCIHN